MLGMEVLEVSRRFQCLGWHPCSGRVPNKDSISRNSFWKVLARFDKIYMQAVFGSRSESRKYGLAVRCTLPNLATTRLELRIKHRKDA